MKGNVKFLSWAFESTEISVFAGISRFSGKRLINSVTDIKNPQLIVMQYSCKRVFLPTPIRKVSLFVIFLQTEQWGFRGASRTN